jgi:serine/threonine protein kinase
VTAGKSTPPTLPGLVYRDRLGAGGYSDVFLYEQQLPKMLVAVKVLHDDGLTDASRQRFTDEANAMASLSSHPYIVQIMAADVCADGRPYLVMQYYPRRNLSVRARTDPLSVPDVLRIGVQISSAVETAHRAGILHRDIKPANILTGQYGDPGLTDFGIAATTIETHAQGPEGMSIPWSPPEVFDSDLAADARSDVYSLAATLFTLLSGRSPFEVTGGNNGALELMGRIDRNDPPSLNRGDVPASLERLLRQAMSKNPAGRPPTAVAFARSLQEVEQELQLKVTSIVIPDDAAEGRSGQDDSAGETRARMPIRVDPYAPVTSVPFSRPLPVVQPPPAPIELIGGTVHRGSLRPPVGVLPEPPVEITVLRPSAPVIEPMETKPPRQAGPAYAVAGVVLIGIVAVVAVLLSGGGKGTPKPQASGSPTTQVNDPLSGVAPPAPVGLVVKAGAAVGTVEVSWTNASPEAGDFFTVTRTDATAVAAGLPPVRAAKTSATVTGVAAGVKACVAVVLVRQNGTTQSPATTGCVP